MNEPDKRTAHFDDAFIGWLRESIRWAVRALSVLMMLVIWW
ncbi:hypothetical protein [Rugamonas fusca]|nr:hypothetical protein [Rugamonas fusca]